MLLFRIWLNATSSNYVDDEWLIRLTRTPLCREAKKKKKKQDIIFTQCTITERQRQKKLDKSPTVRVRFDLRRFFCSCSFSKC